MRAGPMVPPWGLMDTRPGVTAIRAGAIFSPCIPAPAHISSLFSCWRMLHSLCPRSRCVLGNQIESQHRL